MKWTPTLTYWLLTESSIIGAIAAPSQYRHLSFFFVLSLIFYQVFFTKIDIGGELMAECGIGIRLFAQLVSASYYLLLNDAQRDLRITGDKDSIALKPLHSRLWWAAHLYVNPRAVGWSHEARGKLPPRPTDKTTLSFTISQLSFVARCFLFYTVAVYLSHQNPYFNRYGDPSDVTGIARLWRLGTVLYFVMVSLGLSIQYTYLSIVWVTLGLSKPQDWPRLFGSPADMYTIRRFWGVGWHQMFRGGFSSHADFFAKALNLPAKSKLTTYFKLFAVFAISACMHHLADVGILHSWTKSGAIEFFLLQAVGIMVEDGMLALARRAGFKASLFTRILGYGWVLAWFGFCMPRWIDPIVPIGYIDELCGFGFNHDALHRIIADAWRRGTLLRAFKHAASFNSSSPLLHVFDISP
ncbi:hypothetical protein NLJ89_g10429 [Agrocybe chaxingu]|uniref:Wax synthase domain-containing protein n=1 Tax=Agrocybe chaxingu TaxID=84603 RepID=A0A9W8JRB3_9AGAR|nr:hypothetical protein NLJ89_g10429 [Agrocybe chaxingu]